MSRPWLKSYPKGVATELAPLKYETLDALLADAFKRFGDRPCFSNMGRTLSFREIDEKSRAMAGYFQNVLGLKPGDKIAVQLPNLLQTPVAIFGALRAGLTVVNTNPLYTPREMEHQFKDAGVKAIVILANFASNLDQVRAHTGIKPENVIVTQLGDLLGFPKGLIVNAVLKHVKKMVPVFDLQGSVSLNDALARGAAAPLKPVAVKAYDLAFLQYTGGTTGVSKGAMLTHRNVVANMSQISQWMAPLTSTMDGGMIVTALPLYHIFSLTVNCFCFMSNGAHNLLITNPRDIPAFVKALSKVKPGVFTGVNTLFNALCANEEFQKLDLSSLKMSVAGAMALQGAVKERWEQVTKSKVIEGYGLTETSPVACCNPVDGTDRVGTIGMPLPGTDVKLVDESDKDVAVGEEGELCVKGPQVMAGYWQRPDETAKVMLPGGWFKTGDVAVMSEDGYFKIVDRKKDMIDVSGFKVYPNEVEEVSALHPKVFEAACIGVHDERSGEVVKVFVVKKDESLTESELIAHYKKNLVAYKVPKQIEFRKELPKTNVGKVLRRALRDEAHK